MFEEKNRPSEIIKSREKINRIEGKSVTVVSESEGAVQFKVAISLVATDT